MTPLEKAIKLFELDPIPDDLLSQLRELRDQVPEDEREEFSQLFEAAATIGSWE